MFREMFETSQLSSTTFALYLADTCDTLLTRLTAWAEPDASVTFRNLFLLKLTEMVEDSLYSYSTDGADYSEIETFNLRTITTNSVEYLDPTYKFPPDYILTLSITIVTTGSNVVLTIEMKEYSPLDVLKYTITEACTIFTAPVFPIDCSPFTQDNTTMESKIIGVFA